MPEDTFSLASAHLQNERPIWVRLPRDLHAPCHLAVVLDGELYRGGVEALATIDRLDRTQRIGPTLFAFVSHHSEAARWRECPCHPPFAAFLHAELLPALAARYHAVHANRQRALIGLSYTGLAAAFAALQPENEFTRVVAQSGSFWWHDGWLSDHVPPAPAARPPAFYLEVGRKETADRVEHRPDVIQRISQIEGVQRFHAALRTAGYASAYSEYPGGHDFDGWRQSLPRALAWALPPFGH
ncbi:hypothetical protein K0B96_12355 [Horticoccus luteus]|uniref:Esterase n=1 Tax=Horticoccus luteus TaxID=2862869 RepID=A0A8F9XIZ0_9BACT|nr:alpha/beta hydrolase-fold protein [Horticoccus luteus]QYM78098.1 hypothetical protein K0B96_12355 [Horticoccus luteus]